MAIEWAGDFIKRARVFDGLIELSIAKDGPGERYYIDAQGLGTRKILTIGGVLSYGTLKEAQQAAEIYVLGLVSDVFADNNHATVTVKLPGQPAIQGSILMAPFLIPKFGMADLGMEISKMAQECFYDLMRAKRNG
jgi:hypothetical protein